MLHDSGINDPERLFIFGTNESARLLGTSDNRYADGTFKSVPAIYAQLYTIHAQVNGEIFPCFYALLSNKNLNIYNRLFTEVYRLTGNLGDEPNDILFDFELAAMNAFRQVLPNTDIKGCYYHLCSNMWKHVQNNGLQQRYNNDDVLCIHIRMLTVLHLFLQTL